MRLSSPATGDAPRMPARAGAALGVTTAMAIGGRTGPRPGPGHRKTPVWPSEYRPGWGYTHSPCGPAPTRMVRTTLPFRVSNT